MRKVNKSVFFIALLVIAALAYLAVAGVYTVYGDITTTVFKGAKEIGLDKEVGVSANVVFAADKTAELTDEQLDRARDVLTLRLKAYSGADFELYCDYENDLILADLNFGGAGGSLMSVTTPLTARGLFEVRVGNATDENGRPTGDTLTVLISNEAVKSLQVDTSYYSYTQSVALNVHLTKEARELLKQKTTELIAAAEEGAATSISYWIDGSLITTKTLTGPLDSEYISLSFSGASSYNTAVGHYIRLETGALPASFSVLSAVTHYDFSSGLGAVAIGSAAFIALLCLLFIVVYKLPGLCAALALILQNAVIVMILSGFFTDRPIHILTYSALAAVVLMNLLSAFSYSHICNTISRRIVDFNSSVEGAVSTAFDKSHSKLLIGYVVFVLSLIVPYYLFNFNILYKTPYFADTHAFALFVKYLMFFGITAFFCMLLFRLLVKALGSGKSVFPSGFIALSFKRSAAKGDARKLKRSLTIAVAVLTVALVAAAVLVGGADSKQLNGATTVVRYFDDGSIIQNDDLLPQVEALGDGVKMFYGVPESDGSYSITVLIPASSTVDEAAVDALLDEKYPNTFDKGAVASYGGALTAQLMLKVLIIMVITAVAGMILTALTVRRLSKWRAAASVAVVPLIAAICTAALCYLVRVPSAVWTLSAAFGVFAVSMFIVLVRVYEAEAERAANKRETALNAVSTVYRTSLSNTVALMIVFAVAVCVFVVSGLVLSVPSVLWFGVGLICSAVLGVAVSTSFGAAFNLR